MPDEPTTIRESLTTKELAEAEAWKARANRSNAQMRRENAEAAAVELTLRRAEMDFTKYERQFKEDLTADKYYHLYPFNGQVSESSVKSCMEQLNKWVRLSEDDLDIEIVFNSPGGSVIDGMALFDFIQMIRKMGHKVTTTSIGMAASMAGILLQAGDVRAMGAEGWLMIHEASFGASGSMGQVEDTVEWVKMIQKRILNIFAARSKLSVAQLDRRWKRKNWWISSDEALKLGLIDEIR